METESVAETVAKLLTRARSELIFTQPFFGAIALRLGMKEDNSQPTMAVDGYTIFYNVEFVATLTYKELAGVIAHEVLHVAMLHHTRMENRIPKIWNYAADYAINPIILKNGMELPTDRLDDRKYHGLAAEKIYEDLVEDPKMKEAMKREQDACDAIGEAIGQALDELANGGKGFDEIRTPPPEKEDMAEYDAKALTNTGIAAAKQAGKMPGNMEDIIDAAHAVQVDWKDRLRELLTHKARGDQVWHRPNKRLLDEMYLPHFEEVPTGNLVLAIDTSGSVREKELQTYASEIQSIMIDNCIEKLTVLYVDTIVQKVDVFETHDDFVMKLKGRGGTRFEPAFEWVEQQGDTVPDAFLYFTDGEATFPQNPPNYPVIWCITNDDLQAPWGDTINLKF